MPIWLRRSYERLRFAHRGWRYRLRVERAEVAFLLRYYRPELTGIDIGAHKGAFTYWMARRTSLGSRILAFEPLPELAAYLRRIREMCYLPQLSVVQMALSDRATTRTLFRPVNDYLGMTSLVPSDHPFGYDELAVETITLDTYLDVNQDRPVGFIKCDVEGHELEVLRGGRRMLAEDQPVLLLECEDHRNGGGQLQRVCSFLAELGYHCFALTLHGPRLLEQCYEATRRGDTGAGSFRNFGFLPDALARREAGTGLAAPRFTQAA